MSPITTHVLDTARGCPAQGVPVVLEFQTSDGVWKELARGETDSDGRVKDLLPDGAGLESGFYRLTFETQVYFKSSGVRGFFPFVAITFDIGEPEPHYHVPLLLSPYGYSTYRGS